MIDTHYDLLSIAYVAYLKNDYSYLEKISKYFNQENVKGVIANLYFMSRDEMKNELHPMYFRDDVSVLDMFRISKSILDIYLPDTDILYSIEGADFISGSEELKALYSSGLDSLVIAWNTRSKYASGSRSNQGLTVQGIELLEEAIDLGMGIDLSHANSETFNAIINLVRFEQSKKKDICVYASHSNSRVLCDRTRNLSDEDLEKIKSVNGLVGVFSNRNFIVDDKIKDIATFKEKSDMYIEHINHISSIVGFDNVMIATDDMDFCKDADPEYGKTSIYDYSTIATTLSYQLSLRYNSDIVDKIMYNNAKEKIINKIKSKRNNIKRGEK